MVFRLFISASIFVSFLMTKSSFVYVSLFLLSYKLKENRHLQVPTICTKTAAHPTTLSIENCDPHVLLLPRHLQSHWALFHRFHTSWLITTVWKAFGNLQFPLWIAQLCKYSKLQVKYNAGIQVWNGRSKAIFCKFTEYNIDILWNCFH